MAPSKASWDDEDSDSTPPSSPPFVAVRTKKFDDEEDGDVLDDWENDEDSEVEREKAKKAAEAKAKAEAAAKASHKSRSERIEEKREANRRRAAADNDLEDSDDDETEYEKLQRQREEEKKGDLRHAEDLFAGVGGVPASRGEKPITVQEGEDPANAIDLSALKLFNPATPQQWLQLRKTLTQLLLSNSKKAAYPLFMNEFAKEIVRDLNSEQVKKVASGLTTISNEKMKEEKAADKGGKKTKAAKTKTTLNANRNNAMNLDIENFDGGLDDGDFM